MIDKPAGLSSHDVVRHVRRICKTRKVGHAGTLDPLATGVLPVAVNDGTKVLQFLFADNKSYRATLKLGVATDTLDSEGEVLAVKDVPELSPAQLDAVCEKFRGDIMQVPPMYSALKKNGVPLYKLAREGKEVEREARPVTISKLEIIAVDFPFVTIDVDCSKGTYIRTLIDDIGAELGCGAHMTALRRTRSGLFHIDECVTLDQLKTAEGELPGLLSMDAALAEHPAVNVRNEAVSSLRCGVPPTREQTMCETEITDGQMVRLQIKGSLAAMARFAPQRKKEKRGDFELIRVFVGQ
ncbi:tRNA pseudouridine synthase B [Malonomonas rubra DSM 5091]|uniref:tRNA pseudouridine synthase B n=1 Tax=Malonomonas rubra DSM 5091 TaxID=1122189 RepID=A0A1M6KGY8_MALRU|nr:tRNA pseudouridine(55) synthase TruB [Malonomonas rubra]SHJ58142.1 tRNA pseudouridine synthase B [Malonomonas rubra DSM 5091]